MKCSVCGGPAHISESDSLDSQIIKCMVCGSYKIANTVLEMYRWEVLSQEERKDALRKAKRFAKPGQRSVINSRCF